MQCVTGGPRLLDPFSAPPSVFSHMSTSVTSPRESEHHFLTLSFLTLQILPIVAFFFFFRTDSVDSPNCIDYRYF